MPIEQRMKIRAVRIHIARFGQRVCCQFVWGEQFGIALAKSRSLYIPEFFALCMSSFKTVTA